MDSRFAIASAECPAARQLFCLAALFVAQAAPGAELASSRDIISRLINTGFDLVFRLPSWFFDFFIRGALLLVLPLVACVSSFRRGSRLVLTQCFACGLGVFAAAVIP